MNRFKAGQTVEIAEREVVIREQILASAGTVSYLGDAPSGPLLIWTGVDGDWIAALRRFRRQDKVEGRIIDIETRTDGLIAMVSLPSGDFVPFDDEAWRGLSHLQALDALEGLVEQIGDWHRAGCELRGFKRQHLYMHRESGELVLIALIGLRSTERLDEQSVWRDMRLVGELAFEHFMGHDYPGGHQMASMLQERDAMAELGLLQPGLSQLVAGCVSPYGDLAFRKADGVRLAVNQLRNELERAPHFAVGAASTIGNYIFRRNNQDSCGHAIHQSITGSRDRSVGFFCVADGIGGIKDGEKASRAAVNAACRAFSRAVNYYGVTAIENQPNAFARAILKVASQFLSLRGEFEPNSNRGGTTFTGLLVAGKRAGICHVGDSRAVVIRDGEVVHLTQDHTLASILQKLGAGDTQDPEASSRTIARFLSTGMEIESHRVDNFADAVRDELALDEDPREAGLPVDLGDVFVLTSDGAHGSLTDEMLLDYVQSRRGDPQAVAEAINQQSLDRVERDNSTAMVVELG
jgi:protein phosphatase